MNEELFTLELSAVELATLHRLVDMVGASMPQVAATDPFFQGAHEALKAAEERAARFLGGPEAYMDYVREQAEAVLAIYGGGQPQGPVL
jgi:hypothetical protein